MRSRPSTMGEWPQVLLQFCCDQGAPVDSADSPGLRRSARFRSSHWRSVGGRRSGQVRRDCRTGAFCRPPVRHAHRRSRQRDVCRAAPGRVVLVGGSEAGVKPAAVGRRGQRRVRRTGEEVAVVDPSIVELLGQLPAAPAASPASERQPRRNLHSPLDDLHGRAAGRRCPCPACGAHPLATVAPSTALSGQAAYRRSGEPVGSGPAALMAATR
jgi:hypothetical protein